MWQLCHFKSNPEWVILNLKGNNVNIVKSRKNGETRISQYLVIHVIKRIQVKVFCVSSPGWCVACFDLKTLDNIPTDDTFECYEKKYSSWKTHIISYLIRNMNNRILLEHKAKFFVSLPRAHCSRLCKIWRSLFYRVSFCDYDVSQGLSCNLRGYLIFQFPTRTHSPWDQK